MEAGNILLLPGFALFTAYRLKEPLGPAFLIAALPAVLLLAAGAAYWRSKYRLLALSVPAEPVVRHLARAQTVLLLLTGVGVAAALAAWLLPDFTASRVDRWAATVAAALAVLEYVNYYHVQLQHFDRITDLRRLFTGRGFRRSHLRRDIDALSHGRSG
jgi:uncharacterized membrane protein